MSQTVFLTGILLIVVVVNVRLTESCKFNFPDVCKNVTCPNGKECLADTSYYCDDRLGGICRPVATCSYDIDPCENHTCPDRSACVKVPDVCDAGICTMKAQCNVRNRPGKCPRPENMQVTSCSNHCRDSDHMCPINNKCCFSSLVPGKFCVRNITGYDATEL